MRISDWSSDVCSSDLADADVADPADAHLPAAAARARDGAVGDDDHAGPRPGADRRGIYQRQLELALDLLHQPAHRRPVHLFGADAAAPGGNRADEAAHRLYRPSTAGLLDRERRSVV